MTFGKRWAIMGLSALATAAMAQDGSETAAARTPANAQRFLAVTPPIAVAAATSFMREGEVTSPDACTTQMSGPAAAWNGSAWTVAPTTRTITRAGIGVTVDGQVITEVDDGFPAKQAGLRKGDRILSIDDRPIATRRDYQVVASERAAAGAGSVRVAYVHDGAQRVAQVNLSLFNDQITVAGPPAPPGELRIDWSKVEQVEAGGTAPNVHVTLRTPSDPKRPAASLIYAVAETRDRVLAAAQYLKQACDRSKELGF